MYTAGRGCRLARQCTPDLVPFFTLFPLGKFERERQREFFGVLGLHKSGWELFYSFCIPHCLCIVCSF